MHAATLLPPSASEEARRPQPEGHARELWGFEAPRRARWERALKGEGQLTLVAGGLAASHSRMLIPDQAS